MGTPPSPGTSARGADGRGCETRGYFSLEEVLALPGCPGLDDLRGRRLVVVECGHAIPCDPCQTACPTGAITVGDDITALPVLDAERCDGCGNCQSVCPGLAIFIVDMTRDDGRAELWLPHEFLPFPEKGEIVGLRDRAGAIVGEGEVRRVRHGARLDRTTIVHVLVPDNLAMVVRGVEVKR
jgi:Pyruvate/2-oxoacid:ferredoxin oxidoreductase delta subunit